MTLTLVLLYPAFANNVDPDQLASDEANWSGSALYVIQYSVFEFVLTIWIKWSDWWELEVGVAS